MSMSVTIVLQFIERLKQYRSLITEDVANIEVLTEHFRLQDKEHTIEIDDLIFLLKMFHDRWNKIKNTKFDYMFYSQGINGIWIQFAKDLGAEYSINYLYILFPNSHMSMPELSANPNSEYIKLISQLALPVDCNDLSRLDLTRDIQDLYLGFDNVGRETLFNKQSLCDSLLRGPMSLLTRRATFSALVPVSIRELTQFHRQSGLQIERIVGEERFHSYWDFLQQKIFPLLNQNNSSPSFLLYELLALIEKYYMLMGGLIGKSDLSGNESKFSQAFSTFQKQAFDFFTLLEHSSALQVNNLYGLKIGDSYLVELLVKINRCCTSDEFHRTAIPERLLRWRAVNDSLEKILREISAWYCQFNPVLKDLCVIPKNNLGDKIKCECTYQAQTPFYHCKAMLFSFFCFDFADPPLPPSQKIHLLDISRKLFHKIAGIYQRMVKANDLRDLNRIYNQIIAEPVHLDPMITLSTENTRWFRHAKAGTLYELGVYWFEPEIMMQVLSLYRKKHHELKPAIDIFLNKLIQTYTLIRDLNELQMQLRVNIIFLDFIASLLAPVRKELLIQLNVCSYSEAKGLFLRSCQQYIIEGLQQRCPPALLDSKDLWRLEKQESIAQIISDFKGKVDTTVHRRTRQQQDSLEIYLHQLSEPIIAAGNKSSVVQNFLGER